MKTIFLKSLWSLSIVLLIASCSKDVPIQNESNNQQKSTIELIPISSQDGILQFKSMNDFKIVVKDLNGKGLDYIKNCNQKWGIRSQEIIYHEIHEAENVCRENQASQLDPDITFEQFKEAGLTWDHSDIYNEYIRKGLIIEMTDPDGSKWYKHKTLNPTFMPLIDEQGFVMINDTLYQFASNQVKFSPQGSFSKVPQMINTKETIADQNIFIVNYTSRKKSGGGDWSNITDGPNQEPWIYDGNKKRIMVEVVAQCPDLGNGAEAAFVTFYLEVTSHKKVLFWWNVRNDYMPINTTQGSWDWYETYSGSNDHETGSHYYTNFPWSGYTNYCKFFLEPNGWVGKSGQLLYSFEMNDYTFSVVASGYQTSALTLDIP